MEDPCGDRSMDPYRVSRAFNINKNVCQRDTMRAALSAHDVNNLETQHPTEGRWKLGIISIHDTDTSVCVCVCVCVLARTSESESDELEDDDDEESLELSDAMPVDSCRSTLSASAARSGLSCFRILKQQTSLRQLHLDRLKTLISTKCIKTLITAFTDMFLHLNERQITC